MTIEQNGYDLLAAEYYDIFHRTCRNFDAATAQALAKHPVSIPKEGLVLEVGCGRGRCKEFLGIDALRIVQLDSSRQMLGIKERESCYLRVHADAASVPLFDEQFAVVVGFLIDPFIGLNFFSEAYRLLRSRGLFLATTPTAEWGVSLRNELKIETSSARFLTKGGATIAVPSTLIPPNQIEEMLDHSGFHEILVTPHCLPKNTSPVSPDIQQVAEKKKIGIHELPIIHLITANKP